VKKLFKYNNKSIRYYKTGNGQPLFFIHGFGEDSQVWRKQVTYFEKDYTVIVPDLPGSGGSELVEDMSIEGMAEVIHEIFQQENIDACPVFGHSMGGYIMLALADKYPNHISAMALVHSSAFADSAEKIANRKKGIGFIKAHSAQEFLKTMIPTLFSKDKQVENRKLIDEQLAEIHNFSGDALVSYYEAMINRPDRTHVLRQATVPLLFMMGKDDVAVPVEDSLKQCHLPEISYIHMLNESGHMGMLEEADQMNSLLGKFLIHI
jgi:pimeloyl-ACP methyl ester carboxylesterase